MFNKYVWNLYLDGGGRKVVETFENTILNGISKEYSSFIYNLQEYYCACSGVLVNTQKQLDEAYDYIKNNPVNKIITIPEDISDSEIEDVFSEVYESEFVENMSKKIGDGINNIYQTAKSYIIK